jgi:hypothetical protein
VRRVVALKIITPGMDSGQVREKRQSHIRPNTRLTVIPLPPSPFLRVPNVFPFAYAQKCKLAKSAAQALNSS